MRKWGLRTVDWADMKGRWQHTHWARATPPIFICDPYKCDGCPQKWCDITNCVMETVQVDLMVLTKEEIRTYFLWCGLQIQYKTVFEMEESTEWSGHWEYLLVCFLLGESLLESISRWSTWEELTGCPTIAQKHPRTRYWKWTWGKGRRMDFGKICYFHKVDQRRFLRDLCPLLCFSHF